MGNGDAPGGGGTAKAPRRARAKRVASVTDEMDKRRSVDWDDPTQNVRELFKAESQRQDGNLAGLKELMQAEIRAVQKTVQTMAEMSAAYQTAQVASETRRIDQLAQTRQEFQNTIRDMLAESVRTTSTLVSTQLVQIQATFDTRVSKLEAGAFTQAGKSSVSDLATQQMAETVRLLSDSRRENYGGKANMEKIIGWAIGIAGVAVAVAVFLSTHTGK